MNWHSPSKPSMANILRRVMIEIKYFYLDIVVPLAEGLFTPQGWWRMS